MLRVLVAGFGLLLLSCGPGMAQDSAVPAAGGDAPPNINACAGVYGALAQEQGNFGSAGTLMAEKYINFARINFEDRLSQLARSQEKGITELKNASEADRSEFYMKLVDAETEGDMNVPAVRAITRTSDACDGIYGFGPSLGG